MSQLLLHNASVISPVGIHPGGVLVRDGKIASVFKDGFKPAGIESSESIDLHGGLLAPGMIDIHIHGSVGVDVQNTDCDGLSRLSEFLLGEAVTGYFATFVPTDDEGYESALGEIDRYVASYEERGGRAQILGVHFEGPFVSHKRCGALQRRHFRTYGGDPQSLALFASGLRSSLPRLMTLAPEIDGGLDLVSDLTAVGIKTLVGHTQADPGTLDLAAERGARHITHFPNALDPLHHRDPGAVAWGLVRADVTMDCIADFHHVHPLMLKLIYQAKGAERLALISDAIMPAGLGDGQFRVWGDTIAVRDGLTSLVEGPAAGAIAGSVITMRGALKNIVSLGVSLEKASQMASLVPARVSGVARDYGSVEESKWADLIAFDEDIGVRLAVVHGKLGFDRR